MKATMKEGHVPENSVLKPTKLTGKRQFEAPPRTRNCQVKTLA